MPPVKVSGTFNYIFYNTQVVEPDFSLIDLSEATDFIGVFRDCSKLLRIKGVLDIKASAFFSEWNNATNLITMYVKNLGGRASSGRFLYSISPLTKLSAESLTYLIENLFDRKTAGYASVNITFGTTLLNKLSAEQKSSITAKGFTYT